MILTDAQKADIIRQRLEQFEAERFQHELNKATAEALGDAGAAANADQAMAVIDVAISTHTEALEGLSVE